MEDTITVEERPNAWGFYGNKDRTGYAVMWNGGVYQLLCYRGMAEESAKRLRKSLGVP